MRQQCLVGRDHTFTGIKRVKNEFFGNSRTTDQFHHDIALTDNFRGISGEQTGRDIHPPVSGNIQICDPGQYRTDSGPFCNNISIKQQIFSHSGTDCTETDDSDFILFHETSLPVDKTTEYTFD